MEILEYFDEYKEPWRILSRDIDESLAKAYVDKLCYDKDSPLLNGASKIDVLKAIVAAIGIGRMKTFIHTLVSFVQMKHLAVDAALSRVECEKFYIENKDCTNKRLARPRTSVDDRMTGIFAALKADNNSALDFSLLNKMAPEEKTYRIHCIALKLFCTLWLRSYHSNSAEAGNILPAEFPVYTMITNGRKTVFTAEKLFAAMNEPKDKTAASQGIDETSITYFLTTDAITYGLYANVALIEAMWGNISSAPTARKYLDALCNNISDIASPLTEETNGELLECCQDYDMLVTLHNLAAFTSVNGCRAALDTDAIKKNRARQEEISALLYDLNSVDMNTQQLAINERIINNTDMTTVTVVYGDEPLMFTLNELEDKLVDHVAIIPALIDKGDRTYAVCECEYRQFLEDSENQAYWQPADDLLYFKYIKQQARQIQPQHYDIAKYMITPDMRINDSFVENLGASLIKPTLHCHTCGRLMLPTSNFLSKLSLAAMNRQISTGGQLDAAPVKNSDGFILNHTANAIAQKMVDLNKGKVNSDVDSISWPDVVAIGSKHEIEHTNVFVQPAYADYFITIAKAVTKTQANRTAAKLEADIACIAEAGRGMHLGFSRLDYLYTLVTLCDNAKINMRVLAMQSRVYYGAETMLAYIRQAKAAVNSKLYDTNIYDKMDMPFGYENIRPLLDCIYSPAECISKLGFSSLDELIQSIVVSERAYAIANSDAVVNALMPVSVTVPNDSSISREQYETLADKSAIETHVEEMEPGRAAILAVLAELEGFYIDLSSMAHGERNCFFDTIVGVQTAADKIYALSAATDVDNVLSSAELSILSRSIADIEFWEVIDTDRYAYIIATMANELDVKEVSPKSSVIGRSVVDNLLSTDKQTMMLELDAEAIGRIIVDTSTDLPSLSCLHHRFTGNSENTYEHMVATYLAECGLLEDTGAFLADEAADFAIKIYYECVVDDAVSLILKKHIAANVTTEAYYSTGGFEH